MKFRPMNTKIKAVDDQVINDRNTCDRNAFQIPDLATGGFVSPIRLTIGSV